MNVSVVIPTYSGKAQLSKNLPSVFDALLKGDELLIVEDAGTDDTVSFLTKTYSLHRSKDPAPAASNVSVGSHHGVSIVLIESEQNRRFAATCNLGVSLAKHAVIILLNNDVSVQKNFRQPLLTHFAENSVFAVGCKEIATSEGNKEYGRAEGWFERGFFVHKRADNQNGSDTAWVAGGSGAFRKSMWDELEGFDTDYKPAYWEDIDLSYRAQQKGWKTLFEPQSIVFHNHESTNSSVFGKKQMEIMAYKNQILFMWKNASSSQLISHFAWLPYHLVFTTLRSHGTFLHGLVKALQTTLGFS